MGVLKMMYFVQRYWHWLTLLMLVLITTASLYPADQLPEVPGSDKTHHLISYFLLALPLGLAQPKHRMLVALALIGWGGAIELIQPYVNRYGEWLDFAANSGGVLLGLLLGWVVNKLLAFSTEGDLSKDKS